MLQLPPLPGLTEAQCLPGQSAQLAGHCPGNEVRAAETAIVPPSGLISGPHLCQGPQGERRHPKQGTSGGEKRSAF